MKSTLPLFAVAAALVTAPALMAQSGDAPLAMMQVGRYDCDLAGPPPLLVPQPQPDKSFTITGSTTYRAANGSRGHYLYSAGNLVMTSGVLRGERFSRQSDNRFHGDASGLRCVRSPGSAAAVQ